MNNSAHISFSIHPFEGAFAVIPLIGGVPLTEIVQAFENEKGFTPAGGYGGLVPQWFNYGSLDRYFLGDPDNESYFGRMGRIYLLGCQCGEVGCWPFAARVRAETDTVMWDSFQQPHRPERDYSQFGPFVFEGSKYRQAVTDLQVDFSARVPNLSQDP